VDRRSDDHLTRAADALRSARRVVALTGAGISAESGVPTFRGGGGLWEGERVEDVATPEAFARNPDKVWRFYNARRAGLTSVSPNGGHQALVELERRLGENFLLVTQNVDGLHKAAGSRRLVEIHGCIRQVRCSRCPHEADRGLEPLGDDPRCPDCGHRLRPDIVWFGEMLPEGAWERALEATASCDVMLVIGCGLAVYPAAGLVPTARRVAGAKVIEVNPEPAAEPGEAIVLAGPAGVWLPRLLQQAFPSM
jgi:NAD-dependent deacetylase